jgi:hypothetical protein
MLMRFHWGLAVGHVYSHRQWCTDPGVIWGNTYQNLPSEDIIEEVNELSDQMDDLDNPTNMDKTKPGSGSHTDGSGADSDDEDYDPADEDDSLSSDEDDGDSDYLGLDEMYGQGDSGDEDE